MKKTKNLPEKDIVFAAGSTEKVFMMLFYKPKRHPRPKIYDLIKVQADFQTFVGDESTMKWLIKIWAEFNASNLPNVLKRITILCKSIELLQTESPIIYIDGLPADVEVFMKENNIENPDYV